MLDHEIYKEREEYKVVNSQAAAVLSELGKAMPVFPQILLIV